MPTKNKKAYRAYMREYMRRRYHEKMAEFREMLGGQCARCGSKKNLQFDHIDRRTKKNHRHVIGSLWNKPADVIEAELKKCQLLCADCHLIKSREEGDMPPASPHGAQRRYAAGCRCGKCVASQRAREEEQRRRSGVTKRPPRRHGTRTMYNTGCRCDACRSAQTLYMRDFRTRSSAARTSAP